MIEVEPVEPPDDRQGQGREQGVVYVEVEMDHRHEKQMRFQKEFFIHMFIALFIIL